jgi:hypothetical protein
MEQKNEYGITKTTKYIFLGLFSIIPILIVFLFLKDRIWGPSLRQSITEDFLSESAHGVVDSLYNDKQNHNIRTAIFTNNTVFYISELWENYIQIGDSLSKNQGTLLLEVYRHSRKTKVLDYRKLIPPR